MSVSRRQFLQGTAAVGGGLAVSFHLPGCSGSPADRWGGPQDFVPNANLRITADDRLVFTLARVEMGQGTLTSQVMIVAEELGIDPELFEVEFAPAHADFGEPEYGVQVTGGSTSTRNAYPILTQVGAVAREALLGAAASQLKVGRDTLSIDGKRVVSTSGKSASFGELAQRARNHIDENATPKPRDAWTVIGRDRTRLDAQSKVDGSAVFAADHTLEGTETAVIVRGPLGATPTSVDDVEAKKVKGVRAVMTTPYGVAVVAKHYYQARKAADRLKVEWSASDFSTDAMWKRYAARLDTDEGIGNARDDGDASGALKAATDVVEAEYRLPFLNHATMEPQNCLARVDDGGCEVWTPTQAPQQVAMVAAKITGLPASKIKVHQTLLGGGFGRRSETDYVAEAVYLAKERGAPVRVQWSREDDVQHDFYRPASLHRLRAKVSGESIEAWEHRVVQQSVMERAVPLMLKETMPSAFAGVATWAMLATSNDPSIIEGADGVAYAIPNISVGYQKAQEPVPTGFWRSVGHSSNAFVVESFVDELAARAKRDPVELRRELLKEHPRHLGVLEAAARAASWGSKLPEGHAHGVAVHESFHSYVAVVAQVSVANDAIRVHKLTAAVDCGTAIHPDGVRAQIEGGMIFALGPTLTQAEITFEQGRVLQSNFHDFQTLRFAVSPEVEVHIVDSREPPSGVGEPGVPPTAPAVANAVFALTGKRLRSLPLRLS